MWLSANSKLTNLKHLLIKPAFLANIDNFLKNNFNINYFCTQKLSLDMKPNKKHHACQKIEHFPIEDVSNLKPDLFKCDLTTWFKFLDDISKAKAEGKLLPTCLHLNAVAELLELDSPGKRLKYFTYLFKKEKMKLSKAEKKLKKKTELRNALDNVEVTDHIDYGLWKNNLIMTCRKRSQHKFHNMRLANAILFGQKIVFDLSYDEFMWKKERRDCIAQLRLVYSLNREHCNPYDLYFCNANPSSFCIQYLHQEMPNIDDSLITLTDKSYLDIFPKEQLVYLSPHATETLTKYDHSAIYIIGGFVDTLRREHISLRKSRDENIKSYALPLDDHIIWGCGSRSLSINQVFSIMMSLRDTANWKEALKHVPTRKIRKIEQDKQDLDSDKMFLIKN